AGWSRTVCSTRAAGCSSWYTRPSAVASIAPSGWRCPSPSWSASTSSCRRGPPTRDIALALAMRKRFCASFNFELQAAATDDGIVLSLGAQHSFPLDSVFSMVRRATLADDLAQAALAAPMFSNRWRWNASRALAVLRFEAGQKVPMPLQRMRADDLLGAVFPEQLGCAEN